MKSRHVAGRTWIPGMEKGAMTHSAKGTCNKKVMVCHAYEFKRHDFGIYWDLVGPNQEARPRL